MKLIQYQRKTPQKGLPGSWQWMIVDPIPDDEVIICEMFLRTTPSITYQGPVVEDNHVLITSNLNNITFFNKKNINYPGPPSSMPPNPIGFVPLGTITTDVIIDIEYLRRVMIQYKKSLSVSQSNASKIELPVELIIDQFKFIIELIEMQIKENDMYKKRVDTKIRLIEELRKNCTTKKGNNTNSIRKSRMLRRSRMSSFARKLRRSISKPINNSS